MHGKTKFVLKSATNGGNVDVLVMDEHRWASEGWNRFKLAEYAQKSRSPRARSNGLRPWR